MRTQRLTALILAAAFAAVLVGCNKTPEPQVASPDCAPLASMTEAQKADPAFQAELLKKCPRSGPEFKPSPKKSY